MENLIQSATSALLFLYFIFHAFLFVFVYLSFLYWSQYYKKLEVDLTIRGVVHNFYILLTAATLVVTLFAFITYSMDFYVMSGVFLMLVLVLVYLLYLRRTRPFQYAIISQELPRLPLILTVIVTISGMGFTYVAMVFESALLACSLQVELVVQQMEQSFNSVDNSLLEEEKGNKDVVVPTPVEPKPSLPSEKNFKNFLWGAAKGFVDQRVEGMIDSPIPEKSKGLYKDAYNVLMSKDRGGVYDAKSLDIKLGTTGISTHTVEIVEEGVNKKVTALCFDRDKVAEMASILVPNKLLESALRNLVPYKEGCMLVEGAEKGGLRIITTKLGMPLIEKPSQPPSSGDHDLQAARFFRK